MERDIIDLTRIYLKQKPLMDAIPERRLQFYGKRKSGRLKNDQHNDSVNLLKKPTSQ